jgi:hypothetical protein
LTALCFIGSGEIASHKLVAKFRRVAGLADQFAIDLLAVDNRRRNLLQLPLSPSAQNRRAEPAGCHPDSGRSGKSSIAPMITTTQKITCLIVEFNFYPPPSVP